MAAAFSGPNDFRLSARDRVDKLSELSIRVEAAWGVYKENYRIFFLSTHLRILCTISPAICSLLSPIP
jgi:hypothetical protein